MVNNKRKRRKEKKNDSTNNSNISKDSKLPNITICTPTYNRREHFKNLLLCYEKQTYPKELIEWIIIDDEGQEQE